MMSEDDDMLMYLLTGPLDSQSLTSDSEEDGVRQVHQSSEISEEDATCGHSSGHASLHGYPLPVHKPSLPHNDVSILKDTVCESTSPPQLGSYHHTLNMNPDMAMNRGEMPLTRVDSPMNRDIPMSRDMKALEKHSSRDYDWLKSQCESAMNELQSLKIRHGEVIKKCDQAVKEADMYKQKYKLTKEKVNESADEIHMLKAKFRETLSERQRLEQEVTNQEKQREEDRLEIEDLRQQQRQVISESGSSEVLNQVYTSAVDKYEAIKIEYDELRKRYADLQAAMSATSGQNELLREENVRIHKLYEEASQEKNLEIKQRKALQQQCTSAIMKWDGAVREKGDLEKEFQKVKSDCDEYTKKLSHAMAEKIKSSKDVGRLRIERDAMVHEYSLIMSERDSVHKEIEQLQEKLMDREKKVKAYEEEKKKLLNEIESLRREVTAALHDRDRAMKQVYELKERQNDLVDKRSLSKEDNLLGQDREGSDMNGYNLSNMHLHTSYDKASKEALENKELVSKEAESLKREMDKLQGELQEAINEAEVAKRRRDWAFSERDKIVLERESIKTLCDKLRRERDRAVSDLAEALRDLDELKKQKNEATKELKDVREKHEALLEKEARKNQLNSVGHNHSRDSAIDLEWETETLEFDINGVTSDDLGFDMVGGKDDPAYPNDNSIFVSSVSKDCSAHGKLKPNDHIIKVNNIDVTNVERKIAIQAAKSSGGVINMVVRRRKSTTSKSIQLVHISLSGSQELGISLEQGLYVSRILPGSPAAREGSLAIGDRIIHVNGHSVENLSVVEVMRLVEEGGDMVILNVLKYTSTPQPSLVSSSASSNQILSENSPDVPSNSPKSPRSTIWYTVPPDSGKTNSMNLKTSGSQTDSLDSPQSSAWSPGDASLTSRSHQDVDKPNLFDRAKHFFVKPFQSDRGERHKEQEERDSRRELEREHESLSKSGHINSTQSDRSTEEEVINELNAIINQYTQTRTNSSGGMVNINSKSKDRHTSRREKDFNNGGTWPKCRGSHVDYTSPSQLPAISPPKKERPPLITNFIKDHSYASRNADMDSKVPPAPPERSDSFKRASIKHNPPTPDSSKYSHPHMNVVSSTSKSNYLTSPTKISSSHILQSPVDKMISQTTNYVKTSQSMHYGTNPSTDSVQYAVDNTVVSAMVDNHDVSQYIRKQMPSRPTSASPTSRKQKKERAAAIHGVSRRDYGPSKPTSLDIHPMYPPMYSPRPLPHTAHTITPSGGATSARDTSGSFNKNHPYTMKNSKSLPSSVPHQGHVFRSTTPNLPVYCVSSQRVSTLSQPSQSLSSSWYNSPPPGYSTTSRSGNILNTSIPEVGSDRMPYKLPQDRYNTPSPSPSQQSSTMDHSVGTSIEDFPYQRMLPRSQNSHTSHQDMPPDGSATFPNRSRQGSHFVDTQRIRIPSNQSIISSSIERMSDRGSPISPVFMPGTEYRPVPHSSSSLPPNLPSTAIPHSRKKRPAVGETRSIYIEKSLEPLGITINPGADGGIFVSTVSVNSLAAQAGIEVGDQLLEVCGINMRNATKQLASNVLRQCGNDITMLVQYNPEKYEDVSSTSSSSDPSSADSSATNTPETGRSHKAPHLVSSDVSTITPDSPQSMSPAHTSMSPTHSGISSTHSGMSPTHTSMSPTLTNMSPSHSGKNSNHTSAKSQTSQQDDNYILREPRFVFLKKTSPQDNMGIGLIGGNAVGIFIRDIQPNSIAAGPQGLRCGDQILEYNGTNLRDAIAEQAALEISKPAETVSVLAQYNIAKYNKVQDQPGDSIYVRVLVDREPEEEGELKLKKDDILYVDNTLYNGMLGVWRAWLVDDEGNKLQCGTIPSKSRLENEMAQKRSMSDIHDDELKGSRRGSASARRSFFRRKKHQRNNSKDSRELNSFSDVSINSDSVSFLDADMGLGAYQRVERLDCMVYRPVLILGALAESLISKLTSESPDKYCRCEPDIMKATVSTLETGMGKGVVIDFKRRDSHYECITVAAVKEIIEKNRHCMLNTSPAAIEAMHKVQIYPIVLFIRHKSPKQIREVRDTRFLPEKMSNKMAKELAETYQKIDQEYKHLFSEVIPGGNLAFMCFKIKAAIDKEQKKTLWIPAGSI